MGLILSILEMVFGNGRNALRETVEVFREGAEAGATRDHDLQRAAIAAFVREFDRPRKGRFDRIMDGVNRLPRPMLAFGCMALLIAAMVEPVWFSTRMQGIALVPEPLWWLLGVIVSFYFGARHQAKGQEFQQSVADTLSRTSTVVRNIEALEQLRPDAAPMAVSIAEPDGNPALADWHAQAGGQGATK
ncbi:holin family protein [Shimia biformata]|uniref:holin family protein n=1 Tax=Shimia biformata TaxID=1294299 RepID=UPI00194E9589|nr:holin family protein [Shimia biformata]